MIRLIYVVTDGRAYDPKPIIAFSTEADANNYLANVNDDSEVYTIQLVEGSILDELTNQLERKLEREGVNIKDVEFEVK